MNDTHPKIERERTRLLRQMTPEQRLMLAVRFSSSVIELSREQFAQRYGELGLQRWLEAHYGPTLAQAALQARKVLP